MVGVGIVVGVVVGGGGLVVVVVVLVLVVVVLVELVVAVVLVELVVGTVAIRWSCELTFDAAARIAFALEALRRPPASSAFTVEVSSVSSDAAPASSRAEASRTRVATSAESTERALV